MIDLNHAVGFQRTLWREALPQARCIVDATVGNGHDFYYLAEHCADETLLLGFDIQPQAVAAATQRMEGCKRETIKWQIIEESHANLGQRVALSKRPIDILIFNLGYLPGGNHEIMTAPASTVQALQSGLQWLAPNGLITVVAYPGTVAGADEEVAVRDFLSQLPQKNYDVSSWRPLNQRNHPPVLYIIRGRNI